MIAATGVMLVPDASFQGTGNRWTSYLGRCLWIEWLLVSEPAPDSLGRGRFRYPAQEAPGYQVYRME